MNVSVRPVVQVDRWNTEGGVLVYIVIAAHRVGGVLGPQRLFAPTGREQRVVRGLTVRKALGLAVQPTRERPGHIVYKGRQTQGPACDMKHRLRVWPPSDHVHVNGDLD